MGIGRVIGTNVMETRFRIDFEENLQVGELLVVESPTTNGKYLVRVMNIEHAADKDETNWMSRTAGMIMKKETPDISPYAPYLFCVGVSSPLGFIDDASFKKTKTLPTHFAEVRYTQASDYEFLKPYLGNIEIGNLRSGDKILDFPVGISERAVPYHIGIFATTGMGKSNLMKNLALSCMMKGDCGFLIFDPHGEYFDGGELNKKGLKDSPYKESFAVYSSRDLSANGASYSKLIISSTEIEISDLEAIYEFTEAQKECLQTAQYKYKEEWLNKLDELEVERIVEDLKGYQSGTIGVIKRRLSNLFRLNLISKDRNYSVTARIINQLHEGKTILVDTSNAHETEELLISTVISRAVFEKNKALYSESEKFSKLPNTLIAIEEAQRVLKEADDSVFAQIAREGRKFKTGLCAVSQQPKLIANEVISQFNTLFILGLSDKKDREILKNSAKQDVSQVDNEIQMLMPGEAIVASPFTPFAVPVKVHLYEERLKHLQVNKSSDRKKMDEGFF
ncbi:ATP-binding protein [Candidatus Methanomassiliicoccus intestinalis]|uniref:ATP-binding protein n=1 Tax=Candidatus Methanomassiliicoccus intestinalis TaxID=1406512 RepID=UPI0037DC41F0